MNAVKLNRKSIRSWARFCVAVRESGLGIRSLDCLLKRALGV